MERTRLFTLAVFFLLFTTHFAVAQTVTKDAAEYEIKSPPVESEAVEEANDDAVKVKNFKSEKGEVPIVLDGADFGDAAKTKKEYMYPTLRSFVPAVSDSISLLVKPWFPYHKIELGAFLKQGIVYLQNGEQTSQICSIKAPLTGMGVRHSDKGLSHSTSAMNAQQMLLIYRKNSAKNVSYIAMFDMSFRKIIPVSDKSFDSWYMVKSHDERKLAWATAFDGTDYDVFVGAKDSIHTADIVYDDDGLSLPMCFSPNGRHLLICNRVSAAQSYLQVVNLKDLTTKRLTPITDTISHYSHAHWLANSNEFLVLSNWQSDITRLNKVSAETNQYTALSTNEMGSVKFLDYHPESNNVMIITEQEGTSKLYVDIGTGGADLKEVLLPEPNNIQKATFSQDGKSIAFDMGLSDSPRAIYTFHLSTYKLDQWTKAIVGPASQESYVKPEMVQIRTFDSNTETGERMINAVYYKPDPAKFGNGPHPILIDIPGGEVGLADLSFNPQIQMLVNELGIAVIQPNLRGSGSSRYAYERLDHSLKGNDAVTDMEYILNWIDKQPELEGNSIAMRGTSYAGWLVNFCATKNGDRIKATISTSGFCDIPLLLNDPKAKKAVEAEFGGIDNSTAKRFFSALSPINSANKVQCPMLIIHGKNDLIVPVDQAEIWHKSLRKTGIDPWLLLLDHEGHEIKSRDNQVKMYEVIVMFLTEHLLDGNGTRADKGSEGN